MQNFQKNAKFLEPRASGGLDVPPLPNTAPNCEFLATCLRNTVVRFRTKSVSIW